MVQRCSISQGVAKVYREQLGTVELARAGWTCLALTLNRPRLALVTLDASQQLWPCWDGGSFGIFESIRSDTRSCFSARSLLDPLAFS